jgi:hypothetical protein
MFLRRFSWTDFGREFNACGHPKLPSTLPERIRVSANMMGRVRACDFCVYENLDQLSPVDLPIVNVFHAESGLFASSSGKKRVQARAHECCSFFDFVQCTSPRSITTVLRLQSNETIILAPTLSENHFDFTLTASMHVIISIHRPRRQKPF